MNLCMFLFNECCTLEHLLPNCTIGRNIADIRNNLRVFLFSHIFFGFPSRPFGKLYVELEVATGGNLGRQTARINNNQCLFSVLSFNLTIFYCLFSVFCFPHQIASKLSLVCILANLTFGECSS